MSIRPLGTRSPAAARLWRHTPPAHLFERVVFLSQPRDLRPLRVAQGRVLLGTLLVPTPTPVEVAVKNHRDTIPRRELAPSLCECVS